MEGNKDKGYGDKKPFKCVSCGKTVMLTKFASALKAQCDDCKSAGAPPNKDILDEIIAERNKKNSVSPTTHNPDIPDNKKEAKCTVCGKPMLIGKFASAKNCVCEECGGSKSVSAPKNDDGSFRFNLDLSKVDKSAIPSIDELYVMPALINNRKLRQVQCPACGHEYMKIIKIMDSSPEWGLVVMYQCHKCHTAITLTEQILVNLPPQPMHILFNYRGEEMESLEDTITDTIVRNALDHMIKICKDNNIDISGIDVPKCREDIERIIPMGHNKNWKDTLLESKLVDIWNQEFPEDQISSIGDVHIDVRRGDKSMVLNDINKEV